MRQASSLQARSSLVRHYLLPFSTLKLLFPFSINKELGVKMFCFKTKIPFLLNFFPLILAPTSGTPILGSQHCNHSVCLRWLNQALPCSFCTDWHTYILPYLHAYLISWLYQWRVTCTLVYKLINHDSLSLFIKGSFRLALSLSSLPGTNRHPRDVFCEPPHRICGSAH